jgi:hypothetical protein
MVLGFLETVKSGTIPIHNYISQGFNLSTTVGTATSANLVTVSDVKPPTQWIRCSKEPILIVFLNKLGLWEMFTSHGKRLKIRLKRYRVAGLFVILQR